MLKSTRLLVRSNLLSIGGMMGFMIICSMVVLVTGKGDNIFGTYTSSGTLMGAIVLMVAGTQLASLLLNLGLSMGATRRGMWGALQLNLLGAVALCVITQVWLDWVLSQVEIRFMMSLQANLTTGPLLVAALLLVGNLGILCGLVKRMWVRVVTIILGMMAVAGTFISGVIVGLKNETPGMVLGQPGWVLWATLGCLAAAAGCAVAVYLKLRKAQINAM